MSKKKKQQKRRQRKTYRPPAHRQKNIPGEKTLLRGLMELESLDDEAEFDDFQLTEDAILVIAEMISGTDEEIKRLKKLGDKAAINKLIDEARLNAFDKVVTPEVKNDIRRRLERLSHRLRTEGQKQRAENIAALTLALDLPLFPWSLFTPLTRAFDSLVRQTLDFTILGHAIARAANLDAEAQIPENWPELLENPEILSRFEAQCETDETLQEVIDDLFDQMCDALNQSLLNGETDLKLFTAEELAVGLAWYGYETEKRAGMEDTNESKVRTIYETARSALDYLNVPDRRQRWLDRLEQNLVTKTWAPNLRDGLQFFKTELAQPPIPDDPEPELLYAYIGELVHLSKRLNRDDSPEVQAQKELLQEMAARLERGEPPLGNGG
ncbi:MAG: hypothetical protein NUW24_13345 [Anaerolineae bacterium]|nr:hypothetical protein [Anaerolineae bacterium]MDH7472852.1 hypothetical protein [Anaerolineae bacterium]